MVEVDLVGVCFPKDDVDVVSLSTESTTVGIKSTFIGSTETREEAKGEVEW